MLRNSFVKSHVRNEAEEMRKHPRRAAGPEKHCLLIQSGLPRNRTSSRSFVDCRANPVHLQTRDQGV